MSFAANRRVHYVVILLAFSAVSTFSFTTAAPGNPATDPQPTVQSELRFAQRGSYSDTNQHRLREGTSIDSSAGYFRQDGDGATFVTDEGLELGGLPNLNLERVARTLKNSDESKSIRWRVSGLITEFSGRNYILISRAIYKSTAPPPAPERLSK